MSLKIEPKEVLLYLNQLGYKNIDAEQLQLFIRDLKKLIKYEDRKAQNAKVVEINVVKSCADNSKHATTFQDASQNVHKNDLLTSGSVTTKSYKSGNSSPERPATVPALTKKGSLVSSSESTVICPVRFSNSTKNNSASQSPKKGKQAISSSRSKSSSRSEPESYNSKTYNVLNYSRTGKRNKNSANSKSTYSHGFTQPCYCTGPMRPKSAVIKCEMGCKPPFPKCDPVNLYKYYERQWKLHKIPGEDRQQDLQFRWCIREKISCGIPPK